VYDLRSGKLVDIVIKDARAPGDWLTSVVGGHWAAWVALENSSSVGSLYLADLETGRAQRLLDRSKTPPGFVALSNDWVLWTDASGDLTGFHLPDLTPVHVAGVMTSDEQIQNLQVSGDLAVLMVIASPPNESAMGPEFPPRWTAIRVVRLR